MFAVIVVQFNVNPSASILCNSARPLAVKIILLFDQSVIPVPEVAQGETQKLNSLLGQVALHTDI